MESKNTPFKVGAFFAILILVVGISLTSGFVGSFLGNRFFPKLVSSDNGTVTEITRQKVVDEENATIDVVKQVSPSVVSIVIKKTGFDFFTGPYSQEQGIGTGFIIDKDGIILTNRHVVSDTSADYIVVVNQQNYDVKKIFRDTAHDVAILKIDVSNLTPVELGDSSQLQIGQKVIAIGYALGEFPNDQIPSVESEDAIYQSVPSDNPLHASTRERLSGCHQTPSCCCRRNHCGANASR